MTRRIKTLNKPQEPESEALVLLDDFHASLTDNNEKHSDVMLWLRNGLAMLLSRKDIWAVSENEDDVEHRELLQKIWETINIASNRPTIESKIIDSFFKSRHTNGDKLFGLSEDFLDRNKAFKEIDALLARFGVAEAKRSELAGDFMRRIEESRNRTGNSASPEPEAAAQADMALEAHEKLAALADLAVNDPLLFAAKIAAADKVRVAGTGRPPTLTHAEREEIRQRRKGGEKVGELATAYGVTEKTIFRINREEASKATQNRK